MKTSTKDPYLTVRRLDLRLKMESLLSKSLRTEKDVVYLIVLIRKFIELDSDKFAYPTLSLFCDWVLHIKINRHRAGWAIVKSIDDYFAYTYMRAASKNRTKRRGSFYKNLKELWQLKKQLKQFLKSRKVKTQSLFGARDWLLFKRLLLNILADAPLAIEDSNIHWVKEACFSIKAFGGWPSRKRLLVDAPWPFFYIRLKTGEEFQLSIGQLSFRA